MNSVDYYPDITETSENKTKANNTPKSAPESANRVKTVKVNKWLHVFAISFLTIIILFLSIAWVGLIDINRCLIIESQTLSSHFSRLLHDKTQLLHTLSFLGSENHIATVATNRLAMHVPDADNLIILNSHYAAVASQNT